MMPNEQASFLTVAHQIMWSFGKLGWEKSESKSQAVYRKMWFKGKKTCQRNFIMPEKAFTSCHCSSDNHPLSDYKKGDKQWFNQINHHVTSLVGWERGISTFGCPSHAQSCPQPHSVVKDLMQQLLSAASSPAALCPLPSCTYRCAGRRCRSTRRTGTQSSCSSRASRPSWCSAAPPELSHTRSSRNASCASASLRPQCTRRQKWSGGRNTQVWSRVGQKRDLGCRHQPLCLLPVHGSCAPLFIQPPNFTANFPSPAWEIPTLWFVAGALIIS